MNKLLAVCAFLTLALPVLQAQPDYLERSDDLSFANGNMDSFHLLMEMLPAAKTDQERAQIYWRLSRDTILDTDIRRYAGASTDSLLPLYKRGESYADTAISLDPNNPMGYYLKACNIGRQEQACGTSASLSQAEMMRKLLVTAAKSDPRLSGPWYVLGQLYEQVPGWPFAFGNVVWAVSLGRKALDASTEEVSDGAERDVPLDYSIQLARHLAKRNWSSAKRVQEQANEARKFNTTNDPVERNFSYEGIVPIPPISDRAEGRQLCQFVISKLQSVSSLTLSQNNDLKNAQETIAGLGQ
ncbi:MAG: hypothetical protein ABSG85_07000 [Spirochaetia bacterium]|jgi:hypothetical protein